MSSTINDEQLVVEVQSRPAIYDKGHKNHHNRSALVKHWREIGASLGCDALACKVRWISMRDYFMRKYRESTKWGRANSSRRKWHLFNNMLFLVPYIYTKNSETSCTLGQTSDNTWDLLSTTTPEEAPVTATVDGASETNPGPGQPSSAIMAPPALQQLNHQRHGKKRERAESESETDREVLRVQSQREPLLSAVEHYFKSLVPYVERFDEMEQLEFRRDVQDLVIKYARRQQEKSVFSSESSKPIFS